MKEIEISKRRKKPELEDALNVHPGHIYRVTVYGMNPENALRFEGKLEKVVIEAWCRDMNIKEIILKEGISYMENPYPGFVPETFDIEIIDVTQEGKVNFGILTHEEEFKKRYDDISKLS